MWSVLSHFSVALEIVQLLWILLCSLVVKQSYIQQNWGDCNENISFWDSEILPVMWLWKELMIMKVL